MAEKETIHEPKNMIEATPEEIEKLNEKIESEKDKEKVAEFEEENRKDRVKMSREERKAFLEAEEERKSLESWAPKTEVGKEVKSGKIKDIDSILNSGKKILEPQIMDSLLKLEKDLVLIGQFKGKFGGGKRRAWRQTQKKTQEGNVLSFSCMAIVGDKKGHVGIGMGKAKETLPSRVKALRNAKLNLIKVHLGFESPQDTLSDPHTVPFVVEGKCGSVKVKLIPAPRGTGLVIGDEAKKILKLAGVKDVYGVTKGHTRTTFNLARACIEALRKTDEELI